PLGTQGIDHRVARAAEVLRADLHGIEMPRALALGRAGWEADPRELPEEAIVAAGQLPPALATRLQAAQLGRAERCLEGGHAVVAAQAGHVVAPVQRGS